MFIGFKCRQLSYGGAYNNHDLNDATLSFRDALKKNPNENLLLRRSFIAELEAGNLDHAYKLAERALKQKQNFNIYASCNWFTRR